jgi:hypothetical protein
VSSHGGFSNIACIGSTPAGNLLAIGKKTCLVEVYSVSSQGLTLVVSDKPTSQIPLDVAFSRSGRQLLVISQDSDSVFVLDVLTRLKKIGQFVVPGRARTVGVVPHGTANSSTVVVLSQISDSNSAITTIVLPFTLSTADYLPNRPPGFFLHDQRVSRISHTIAMQVSSLYPTSYNAFIAADNCMLTQYQRINSNIDELNSMDIECNVGVPRIASSLAGSHVCVYSEDGTAAILQVTPSGISETVARYAHSQDAGGITSASVCLQASL